ncbi:MAG: indolepyruvate oxidoreductase subunit beta [Kiritimatiellae bacterium]|nr:indolepyruvate oxidoreductase subunit beta [Kiritimatiellia bacterium]MDD4736124.1 indolepyruvate oxidoreductase subunit beta [Kiritimatiellia bacterium]
MDIQSVVLAGVGGQGILLASRIVSRAAMAAGYEVTFNEVHGMAQRGGSVIAQIRYGERVYSPLVGEGEAQALAALEQAEALRYAHYLAPDGLAVVSDQAIIPVTAASGGAIYPNDVPERLARVFTHLKYLSALSEAVSLGDGRMANTVLMGSLSNGLNLPIEAWRQGIQESVKPVFLEKNIEAFERGREL